MAEFGINVRKVRDLRMGLGWTQEDLARVSGIGRPAISRIETGSRANVRTTTLQKLAKALGVSADELMLRPLAAREPERASQPAAPGHQGAD
jgi:transcriptional regulator with XRE-family HTH domain